MSTVHTTLLCLPTAWTQEISRPGAGGVRGSLEGGGVTTGNGARGVEVVTENSGVSLV
jgi:hypothetical protein